MPFSFSNSNDTRRSNNEGRSFNNSSFNLSDSFKQTQDNLNTFTQQAESRLQPRTRPTFLDNPEDTRISDFVQNNTFNQQTESRLQPRTNQPQFLNSQPSFLDLFRSQFGQKQQNPTNNNTVSQDRLEQIRNSIRSFRR